MLGYGDVNPLSPYISPGHNKNTYIYTSACVCVLLRIWYLREDNGDEFSHNGVIFNGVLSELTDEALDADLAI